MWFRFDVKQTTEKWVDGSDGKDYTWWKTNVFIRWDAKTGRTIVMILDPIPLLEEELLQNRDGIIRLVDPESLAQMKNTSSPYYIPSLFMEAAVHIHDKAVWGIRDVVRDIEKEREQANFHGPSQSSLDPGMRHTIHATEMLETMLTVATNMLEAHNLFVDENLVPLPTTHEGDPGKINMAPVNVMNRQVVYRLRNAGVALRTLWHRAQANQSRLDNVFNVTAHVISTQIAEAARVDNNVMKTLGLLGTAFLPATLIAALFSMSFFGTDNNSQWVWHSQLWYYFVITIPLTGIVMIFTWRINPSIQAKRAKNKEEKRKAEAKRKTEQEEARRKAEAEASNSSRTPTVINRFTQIRQRTMTMTGFGSRSRTATIANRAGGGEPGQDEMMMMRGDLVPMNVLNSRNDEASTASTVVAPLAPEQQQQQQQETPQQTQRQTSQPPQTPEAQRTNQEPPSDAFAPESPGWPGSPGTADRGFLNMV